MDSKYRVEISIERESLKEIKNHALKMYAFRAVKGPSGGKPLVWYSVENIQETMKIDWDDNFGAFISPNKTSYNICVHGHFATRKTIALGQRMVIDEVGNAIVDTKGEAGTICILSHHNEEYTCGISEHEGPNFNDFCLFPLLQSYLCRITPVAKIALIFSQTTIRTDNVVEKATGPGILIDFTNETERKVEYRHGKWIADTNGSQEAFESGQSLSQFLIIPE
ncbi:MAG: hypothetical protein AB3K77_02180 [Methanosarcinaceae archaeon]